MITTKHTRCTRHVWAYVSRYPHALTREIAGATTDYSHAEIERALEALSALGYVEKDTERGWVAVVRLVGVVPSWVNS